MDNPFTIARKTLSEEDAKRIIEVNDAFSDLFEVLSSTCTNPSRYLSLAISLLEQSHGMAVKSINTEALP